MMRIVIRDLGPSAKWAIMLFLPWIALGYFALAALGGFHGTGGIVLIIMELPMAALNLIFGFNPGAHWWNWAIVIVVEWMYFLVLVIAFRVLMRAVKAKFF